MASAVPLTAGPAQMAGSTVLRPPAGSPATMLTRPTVGVRFRCACGADYQARSEHAGKPVVCPRCNDVLFIPSPAAVSRAGGKPVLASRNRRDQYQPKPEGWSPLVRLGVVLGVVLLLGAGAYGAWAVYFKDVAARTSKQQVSALALVPDKAVGFVFVRPNALLKSKLGQGIDRLPLDGKGLSGYLERDTLELVRLLDNEVGLRSGRVEALVGVIFSSGGVGWVVETTVDIDPRQKDKLITTLRAEDKSVIDGKTYLHSRREPTRALYFVHDRLFILTSGVTTMHLFLQSLDKKKDEPGRLQRAIALTDAHTVLLATWTRPPESLAAQPAPPGQPGQPPGQTALERDILAALPRLEAGATLRVNLEDDKVQLRVDGDAVESKRKDSSLATARLEMTFDIEQINRWLKPPDPEVRQGKPLGPPPRPGGNPR